MVSASGESILWTAAAQKATGKKRTNSVVTILVVLKLLHDQRNIIACRSNKNDAVWVLEVLTKRIAEHVDKKNFVAHEL
jgi:hypothetical protein